MNRPALRAATPLIAAALLVSTACSTGRDAGDAQRAHEPAAQQGHAESGERLYRVSCAGCHGNDARGNGPVAQFLTVPVPDLTRIAARRNGVYPDEEIYRIIDGQAGGLRGHGPRHMPVWGYEFFGDDPDDEVAHRQASEKVDLLVGYLRSLQRAD